MLSTTIRIQCLIILQLIHAYVHKNLKKSFRKKKKRTLILLLSKSYCWNILAFCLPIGFKCYIYLYNIYVHNIYIYIYIHIYVFCPSQDSLVWLGLTKREQLMSPECSKHQVLSIAKIFVVWWTNRKYSVLISVPQSA